MVPIATLTVSLTPKRVKSTLVWLTCKEALQSMGLANESTTKQQKYMGSMVTHSDRLRTALRRAVGANTRAWTSSTGDVRHCGGGDEAGEGRNQDNSGCVDEHFD